MKRFLIRLMLFGYLALGAIVAYRVIESVAKPQPYQKRIALTLAPILLLCGGYLGYTVLRRREPPSPTADSSFTG